MRQPHLTRRRMLRTGAATGAALALPTIFTAASAAAFTNAPAGPTVTLGFIAPQSGPYADEGRDQLRAQALAVQHLNGEGDGGMLVSFSSRALKGNGILGRKVEYVTGDTQSRSDTARAAAREMIDTNEAIMISGGSSSGVAVAVQGLCQEAGVIFMAGMTHANETTGKDRKANGFRHFFNSHMSAAALAPVLAKEYGTERRAYHLTADYNWGRTQQRAIQSATEALGWQTVRNVPTPLAGTDFSDFLAPVIGSGADVLVLNQYGGNMVNALSDAVRARLRDRQVNGTEFQIVVPLHTELMAETAGPDIRGVLGSMNWNWQLQDAGTKAFVRSYFEQFGRPPSNAAQTCYVQVLLYADAVERAGSFHPCAVVEALEGFAFDGLGNGPTLYRAEDHQCFKDVLVMRGTQTATGGFDTLEIVDTTPVEQVTYAPDHPMFAGDAGSCNPG